MTAAFLLYRPADGWLALGVVRLARHGRAVRRRLLATYRAGWEFDGWTVLRRLPAWRCLCKWRMPAGATVRGLSP